MSAGPADIIRTKYTNCSIYSVSWWWAKKCSKHVEACLFSFGYFPGVKLSFSDVSEPSVRSIFKGWIWNHVEAINRNKTEVNSASCWYITTHGKKTLNMYLCVLMVGAFLVTGQTHSHYTHAEVSACGTSDLRQTLAQKLQTTKASAVVFQKAATQDLWARKRKSISYQADFRKLLPPFLHCTQFAYTQESLYL
jgi:hypothetical protein